MSGGTFLDSLRAGPAAAAPQEYPTDGDLALYFAQDTGDLLVRSRTAPSQNWSSTSPAQQPPLVAFVGDSITAATFGGSINTFPALFANANRGPSFWARTLTQDRFLSNRAQNFGVSGDATADVIARLPTILASGANAYVVLIGTNDASNMAGVSYAQVTANLTTIYNALQSSGALVIAMTILPRSSGATQVHDYIMAVNNFIRAQRLVRSRFYVVDATLDYGDPTVNTFAPRTNFSIDGLHPRAQGAFAVTKKLVALLDQLLPPPALSDVYPLPADSHSTNNPGGSYTANAILAGTAGTLGTGGGTISGVVADSWTLDTLPNGGTVTALTVAGSKVTLADGRPEQVITLGGTYTGVSVDPTLLNDCTAVVFKSIISGGGLSNFANGDILQFSADYSVEAASSNVSSVAAELWVTNATRRTVMSDGAGYPTDVYPASAVAGRLLTEPFVMQSGSITEVTVAIRINLLTGAGLTAGGAIHIHGAVLRKIVP